MSALPWLSLIDPGQCGRQVQSLGWEDPSEKGMATHSSILAQGMATHSSILAWEIPQTEDSGGLQSMRSQRVGRNEASEHENQ